MHEVPNAAPRVVFSKTLPITSGVERPALAERSGAGSDAGLRTIQCAALHGFETIQPIVGVQFVERRAVCSGDGVFTPESVGGAVVAVLNADGVGAGVVVVPAQILDPAEQIEAGIDVSRDRIDTTLDAG